MPYPPKVHPKGPSLYYVDQNKWHRLCRIDDPEWVLYSELSKLHRPESNVATILTDHLANIEDLAPETRREYRRIVETRLMPVFGHMRLQDVDAAAIGGYLESRKSQGAAIIANREIAVLSSAFSRAVRLGHAETNPCLGVKRNKEAPKTRYVTNKELRLAMRKAYPGMRCLLWAAYLTGLRQKDLRTMTWDQVTEEGLEIRQSKDGKHILIMRSASLDKVLRRCERLSKTRYVFTNTRGRGWTREALKSALTRLNLDWSFHDLRAKAESDHSEGMGLMARYKRARRVKPVI